MAAVAISAAFSGCVPNKIAWKPDSSGVYFTVTHLFQQSKLFDYDISLNARRLVHTFEARTPWPLIDSSADTFVVVEAPASAVKGRSVLKVKVQLVTYTMAGREVKRSRVFEYESPMRGPSGRTFSSRMENAVLRTNDGEKFLVYIGEGSSRSSATLIYDVATRRWRKVNVRPLLHPMQMPDVIRPDGEGFLAKGVNGPAFVEWTGRVHDIPLPDKPDDGVPDDGVQSGSLLRAYWDENDAVLEFEALDLKIDTEARSASIMLDVPERRILPVGDKFHQVLPTAQAGLQFQRTSSPGPKGSRLWRIELWDARRRTVFLVLSKADFDVASEMFLSPDRKKVAVIVTNNKVIRGKPWGKDNPAETFLKIFDLTGAEVASMHIPEWGYSPR